MISYAQNFEDVMLARALKSVDVGFYVDVGAWEPWRDSVTAYFYLLGWQGVNIEPAPSYADALRAARPRDVTIEAAADRSPGRRTLHIFQGSGCSTFHGGMADDPRLAPYPHEALEVDTMPLSDIFETFAPADVHFLKLDCEGAEEAALAGLDLTRFRPWIVLAEATLPLTQIPCYAAWEPILIEANYQFVYFDGLNRFYVAEERAQALAPAFATPPNVFDQIELARYVDEIEALRRENEMLRRSIKSCMGK